MKHWTHVRPGGVAHGRRLRVQVVQEMRVGFGLGVEFDFDFGVDFGVDFDFGVGFDFG